MGPTWTVARFAETDVRVHWTFPFVVFWFVVVALDMGHTPASLSAALLLLFLACVCVVAHEYGHVIAARAHGIETKEITMLPIGAVSRLEKNPETREAEIAIAAAGPAVSVALAVTFFLLARAAHDDYFTRLGEVAFATMWGKLFWTNVIIAAINLLPALPMDGGKILRAWGTLLAGDGPATTVTIVLSHLTAVLLAALGFVADPFFWIMAALVWACAVGEARRLRAEALAKELVAGAAVTEDFHYLTPDMSVLPVLEELFSLPQRDFPVLAGADLVGFVSRADLAKGVRGGTEDVLVGAIMRRVYAFARAEEKLSAVLARMTEERLHVMPVIEEDRFVGVIKRAEAQEHEDVHQAQRAAVLDGSGPQRAA